MSGATEAALWVGIILGALMLAAVTINFVRHQSFGWGGSIFTVFGVVLVGLSVWKTVEVSVGADGLETRFTALGNKIDALAVVESQIWEDRDSNVEYTAEDSGHVVVSLNANPDHRFVEARGFIGDQLIAGGAAQDSYVEGVPSIVHSSFVMPVPRGHTWKIVVDPEYLSLVTVKWFAQMAVLVSEEQ